MKRRRPGTPRKVRDPTPAPEELWTEAFWRARANRIRQMEPHRQRPWLTLDIVEQYAPDWFKVEFRILRDGPKLPKLIRYNADHL